MRIVAAITLGLCAGAGCSSPEVQPDTPAVRTSLTEASTTELMQVISAANGGVQVTIAEDALTTSSVLVIERGLRRSIDRPPELGRDYGRPQRFQLVLDGRQCFLVQQSTGLRWLLRETTCEPE
jgi:hypothetical protein